MPYQITSLATLQARLADKWEGVPYWTNEEARLALNEGIRWWNLLTAYWKVRVVVVTNPLQTWYCLPTGMIYPLKLDFGSIPMVQTDYLDIDLARPNWEAETTATGGGVPNLPTLWIPGATNLFAIWPADAAGNRTIAMDGIKTAPVLQAPGDFIDLGEEAISALLGFALHVAAFKNGGERFRETLDYFKAFIALAAEENKRLLEVKAFRQLLGRMTRRDSNPGPPTSVPTS
jgi:hypothetical protein